MEAITKTLSKNDTGQTGGHQAGFNVLRKHFHLLPKLNFEADKDDQLISVVDSEGDYFNWSVRWYKSKGEVHITRCNPFYVKWNLEAGMTISLIQISPFKYFAEVLEVEDGVKPLVSNEKSLSKTRSTYSSDPLYRKAVETYSMNKAIDYYSKIGDVEDTSSNNPYDLKVYSNEKTFTVEVKGTASDGRMVLLTKNEVKHNLEFYPNTELYIFKDIEVKRSKSEILCFGGSSKVIQSWKPESELLEPMQFRYRVP